MGTGVRIALCHPGQLRGGSLRRNILEHQQRLDVPQRERHGRYKEETRKSKVGALDDRILELCGGRWVDDNKDCDGDGDEYRGVRLEPVTVENDLIGENRTGWLYFNRR